MREMKDSGVPWIGEIPKDWAVLRNKNAFICSKDIVGDDFASTQLLSLTTKGIKEKSQDATGGKIPESFDTYQRVKSGQLVMCLFDLDCSAVFSGLSPFDGMISPAYKVLDCKETTLPHFADYWFSFVFDNRKFMHYAKNLRYTLNFDEFAVLPIALPAIDIQRRIVDFLDAKCAEIDSVVEQTRASIEEYQELKQSVITEVVTKGIRGNRPMKDSGVEWIGEIPEDWNIVALKTLCRMKAGKNLTSEQIKDEGAYPVYGGNGERGFYNEYLFDGLFLLVGRQGALCGNVHKVEGRFWPTEHALVTTPSNTTDIQYLFYLLISANLNQYASDSAAQPGLSVGAIRNIRVVLPQIQEQQEIAAYLNEKCSTIDSLIASKEALIGELEAYKKSLIYEYVTGKKEVPA